MKYELRFVSFGTSAISDPTRSYSAIWNGLQNFLEYTSKIQTRSIILNYLQQKNPNTLSVFLMCSKPEWTLVLTGYLHHIKYNFKIKNKNIK